MWSLYPSKGESTAGKPVPHCKKGADRKWDEKETNNDAQMHLYHLMGFRDPGNVAISKLKWKHIINLPITFSISTS